MNAMDIVTLSSKGQIVIPSKVRKKFSLKEGDSLVIVEEKDGIRLQPLVSLSELWGVDTLKNTGAMLKEMRKEWDDELDNKAAL
jgi:AbrB family looped-hinge helix DNA binding protein